MQENRIHRIMGIDFGERQIGLAVSDELRLIATPLEILRRSTDRLALDRLQFLVGKWNVSTLIIGLPLNMDGTDGHFTARTASFADKLQKKTALPLYWMDERLSSWEAGSMDARPAGFQKYRPTKWGKGLDAMSAAIILQRFLNGEKVAAGPSPPPLPGA